MNKEISIGKRTVKIKNVPADVTEEELIKEIESKIGVSLDSIDNNKKEKSVMILLKDDCEIIYDIIQRQPVESIIMLNRYGVDFIVDSIRCVAKDILHDKVTTITLDENGKKKTIMEYFGCD